MNHPDILRFLDTKRENADEKIRIKTPSMGIVVPDVAFRLAKENKDMALFSPLALQQYYGKPLSDIGVSEHYDELAADDRVTFPTQVGFIPLMLPSCMLLHSTFPTQVGFIPKLLRQSRRGTRTFPASVGFIRGMMDVLAEPSNIPHASGVHPTDHHRYFKVFDPFTYQERAGVLWINAANIESTLVQFDDSQLYSITRNIRHCSNSDDDRAWEFIRLADSSDLYDVDISGASVNGGFKKDIFPSSE